MKTLADPQELDLLISRLANVRADSKAVWGKMNACQMICHLADAFAVSMGSRTASSTASFLNRHVVKWVALYLPRPWPQNLKGLPELEQGAGATPPTSLDEDRRRLIGKMREFVSGKYTGIHHPMFGLLTDPQWLRWGYLHTDHHLRQFGV